MSTFACHDCGAPLDPGEEIWLAPEDGAPDDDGEPYLHDLLPPRSASPPKAPTSG